MMIFHCFGCVFLIKLSHNAKIVSNFTKKYEVNHYRSKNPKRGTQAQGNHFLRLVRASIFLCGGCACHRRRYLSADPIRPRQRNRKLVVHCYGRADCICRILQLQRLNAGGLCLGVYPLRAAVRRSSEIPCTQSVLRLDAQKGA